MPKTSPRDKISKPPEFLAPVADYFKMLSEPSRLQILSSLKTGPMNVSEIGEATGLGQANLSKHLKMLTEAEILSRQPQGVSVYYEIKDPMIFGLCELVCDRLYERMQQKAERFKRLNTFGASGN
jgi:ArsR family transcriptional regulator